MGESIPKSKGNNVMQKEARITDHTSSSISFFFMQKGWYRLFRLNSIK